MTNDSPKVSSENTMKDINVNIKMIEMEMNGGKKFM